MEQEGVSGLGAGLGASTIDLTKLRQVERLSSALKALEAADGAPGSEGTVPAATASELVKSFTELEQLLSDDDIACIHFRECGGLQAAALLVSHQTKGSVLHPLPHFRLVHCAC